MTFPCHFLCQLDHTLSCLFDSCFTLNWLCSLPIAGIHSFDFLGLGYRVDWPVSIILTPVALKIYSNIFNFLIQVKLAVFSLGDIWFSLKVTFP